jgi:hypothetical protein
MPFFQNPFDVDWSGTWILADHRFMPQFKIGPNRNTADWMRAWVAEPYDCSTNNTLTINYAFDLDRKNYASIAVNVAGATPSATGAIEVCNALNANASFAELWLAQPISTASTKGGALGSPSQPLGVNNINSPNPGTAVDQPSPGNTGPYTVGITSVKRPKQAMRVYISNTGAELALGFNRKAPVAQLPTYFSRHTIPNRFTFSDCTATLVQLDTTNPVDQQVISNAGQDYTQVTPDWAMLQGKSEVYKCFVNTYSGSNLTSQIEYNTGAKAGDLVKKTYYTYSSTNVVTQAEIPYVLQASDLLTPPPT